MKKQLILFVCVLPLISACKLSIINVGAPAVNCVFDPSCTIHVTDSSDTIPLPAGGTNFLQSRTFEGQPGSPAEGLYGYQYRVDLRNAIGITYIPCVSSLKIQFGPVVSAMDYDGDGKPEQVYVVTGGGLGSVGLASAQKNGDDITFTFSSPVCAGGSPGSGQSSFFFGLASTTPPRDVMANVKEVSGPEHDVQARAPE